MRSEANCRRLVALALTMVVAVGMATLFAQAPPPLTNAMVAEMVAAKLDDSVILIVVRTAPRKDFDLTVGGLIWLKQAGVPDAVIAAMLESGAPPPTRSPLAGSRPSAPAPPVPQEAETVQDFFAVNPTNGQLIPLEFMVDLKIPNFGPRTVSLKGAASPVQFAAGEPFSLAARLVNTKLEDLRAFKYKYNYKLERLAVKDGRRYSTGVYVPLYVDMYGQPTIGLSKRSPKSPAQSYLFTPQAALAPGEYGIVFRDMFDGLPIAAFGVMAR